MSYRDDANYDVSKGPSRPTTRASARGLRMPADLTRSRRFGLTHITCAECGAIKDQGLTRHYPECSMPDRWVHSCTEPLAGHGEIVSYNVNDKGTHPEPQRPDSMDSGWHRC